MHLRKDSEYCESYGEDKWGTQGQHSKNIIEKPIITMGTPRQMKHWTSPGGEMILLRIQTQRVGLSHDLNADFNRLDMIMVMMIIMMTI